MNDNWKADHEHGMCVCAVCVLYECECVPLCVCACVHAPCECVLYVLRCPVCPAVSESQGRLQGGENAVTELKVIIRNTTRKRPGMITGM